MATDNKYDRQLRLWGANGQRALAESHVLLLGAGPAGTETLKNLVLPGVGRFTVVDGATVSEADLGNNFFVRPEDVGRPRAAATAELLKELNPDVEGFHRVARPEEVVAAEPDFVASGFSLVIAAQLEPAALQALGERCWAKNVPLVAIRAYGLLGVVRLQVRRLEVVESKPDNVAWDLRLAAPFPELEAAADALDLDGMGDADHAHAPYVLVLAKLAKAWRQSHGGASPKTRAEKDAFRALVAGAARELPSKVPEMNFEEASNEAYRCWADPRELPWEAQAWIDDARAAPDAPSEGRRGSVGSEAAPAAPPSATHVAVAAVAAFMDAHGGLPPLSGAVPDMHADTASFVALQKLYAARADADRAACLAIFAAKLAEATGAPPTADEAAALALVCKHVRDVKLVSTRSLADELAAPNLGEAATALFETDDAREKAQAPVVWYAALRAADRFFVKRGAWPGADGADLAADAAAVADELRAFVTEADCADAFDGVLSEAHAKEIARFGAAELHAIAAVVGGVASQEAVKVLAKQYTPIDHTYLFNGIAATAAIIDV